MQSAHAINIASSTSRIRSTRFCLRSPPVLGIHIPSVSHLKSGTPSLSLTLPSLIASTCKVCFNPSHSMLSVPLLPRDTVSTLAAIFEGNVKKKVTQDLHHRSPCPGPHFKKNLRFPNSRQQLSSSDRNTRVPQSVMNTPPPAKN